MAIDDSDYGVYLASKKIEEERAKLKKQSKIKVDEQVAEE